MNPGPLEWRKDLLKNRADYRASCFICHNNGPRGVRPNTESALASVNWQEKVKLSLWNLRIKTYGRIKYDVLHDEEDKTLKVPFHFATAQDMASLKVPVCQTCHNEHGFLARGELKRQQIGTIEHLVSTGQMPPPGFHLSEPEQKQLKKFMMGF